MSAIVTDLDLDRTDAPETDSWDSPEWDAHTWELGPEPADIDADAYPQPIDPEDAAWWAGQNVEWHATDLITPQTDGISEWAVRLAEAHDALLADADLPEWAIG